MAALHAVAQERDPPGVMVGGSAGRLAPPRAGELGFCEADGHLLLLAARDAKMDGNGAPSRNRRAESVSTDSIGTPASISRESACGRFAFALRS